MKGNEDNLMNKTKKNVVLFLLATQVLCITTYVNKKAKAVDISEAESIDLVWTAQQTANYVLTHLDELNQKRAEDGYLTAVYSGEVSNIIVDMSSQPTVEGLLIDFDGSKGYMVVGPDKNFYAYSSEYNPPFNAFTSGVHHYDEKLGFWYEDDLGNQVILGEPGNDPDITDDNPSGFQYEGQYQTGEYTIYDPDVYMHDRYGEEYELNLAVSICDNSSYMAGFDYYNSMVYYSYLEPHTEDIRGPEINSFLAALSVVDYIGTAKNLADFTTVFKQTYTPNVAEPTLYNIKTRAGLTAREINETTGRNRFRNYVVNTYNDDADLTLTQIKDAIVNYLGTRDIKVTPKKVNGVEVLLKMYVASIVDNHQPSIMYNPTALTYNNHYSAICGVRQYDKIELSFGPIKRIRTKTLVEIRESMWYPEVTYFDVYTYSGTDSQVYLFKY